MEKPLSMYMNIKEMTLDELKKLVNALSQVIDMYGEVINAMQERLLNIEKQILPTDKEDN